MLYLQSYSAAQQRYLMFLYKAAGTVQGTERGPYISLCFTWLTSHRDRRLDLQEITQQERLFTRMCGEVLCVYSNTSADFKKRG